jgi:periplasmic divalent cation tolerance protein
MSQFCQVWLTVGDGAEADKIASALLEQRLVACVRQISVNSDFRWQGKIDHTKEILLQMESRLDLFDQIEVKVAKLHSYDTFVLQATPISKISKSADKWLNKELIK